MEPKGHIHKSSSLVPIQTQDQSSPLPPFCLSKMILNIIHLPMSLSS
jgi:hypothetical protein